LKKTLLRTVLATLIVVILSLSLGTTAAAAGKSPGQTIRGGVQVTLLSAAEISYLSLMREEEKLARDVYLELYGVWELPIFNNIAASEQKHMDAVNKMLDKYGIADPALAPGRFSESSGLQSLYDQLTARGGLSQADAFEVGVIIEEEDIADLREAIAATAHTDILRVYNNLLSGSLRHLAAFSSNLD
jgi:hypothetical protein